jgi:putative sigma-54 modulation protein
LSRKFLKLKKWHPLRPVPIVRTKRFEVSSVTPEDAIEQMELLGHFFYLFIDATDGRLSVIYKR